MSSFFTVFTLASAVFLVISLVLLIYYVVFNHLIPIMFYGAFFAKTPPNLTQKILLLANVRLGQKAVDLGSGDGRLVIAMAKLGVEAHGYEINPFLVILSKINIKRAGLDNKAFVYWGSFWQKDLSEFDIVVLYGISYIMKKLEVKLKKELKSGAKVISNYFMFSNWSPEKQDGNIYLYLKK